MHIVMFRSTKDIIKYIYVMYSRIVGVSAAENSEMLISNELHQHQHTCMLYSLLQLLLMSSALTNSKGLRTPQWRSS